MTSWRIRVLLCVALAIAPVATSQGPEPTAKDDSAKRDALRLASRPTPVDRAVDRGLEFFLKIQGDKGAIAHGHQNRTATTALALLAFLARGHIPSAAKGDRIGNACSKALEFVLANADDDGFFGRGEPRGGMYTQGIVVLLLSEMLGMGVSDEQDARVAKALKKGIDVILEAQRVRKSPKHAGGWRYERDSVESDLSVTVWMLVGLRAANNAGVKVPKGAVNRAVAYVKKCFDRDGGFAYKAGGEEGVSLSMTAAGVLSLQVAGRYDALEVKSCADWLLKQTPRFRAEGAKRSWFYYSVYYYAQAMHQLGGAHAKLALEVVREVLLARQQEDGSWGELVPGNQESVAGPVYRTSMSILALAVDYRYLPIYQR